MFIKLDDDGKILFSADWKVDDSYIETEKEIVRGYDGGLYFAGEEPQKPEPTIEELIEQTYKFFDSLVEKRLNDFAATRRYNDIYTASNYKDSHIEKYATEGQYCYKMLAETYNKCEELLAEYMPDVLAGKRPIPTWEEIEAQLPVLQWPDEVKIEETTEEPSVEEETINESK